MLKDWSFRDYEELVNALGGEENALALRRGEKKIQLVSGLIHGLFTPPETQIARWWKWNEEFRLGIHNIAFQHAMEFPRWPTVSFGALVLTHYFDPPQEEIEFYWELLCKLYPGSHLTAEGLSFDADHVRWAPGGKRTSGFRWAVIDLGAYEGMAPQDAYHPLGVPGAAVLAAAALHPSWMQSLDTTILSSIIVPGYQVRLTADQQYQAEGDQWGRVLHLSFNPQPCVIQMGAMWEDEATPHYYVPELIAPAE